MTDSPFLINPLHAPFLDGSNRKVYGVRVWQLVILCVFGILVVGLGLGLTIYAVQEQGVYEALDSRGVQTLATVTDGRVSSGRSTSYYLTYAYDVEVNGDFETFSREESVTSRLYRDTGIGQHIAIRYLPDDPRTARAVDEGFNGLIFLLMGLAFIFGWLWLLFTQFRLYRRERLLEREGQILTGRVEKSWISGGGNKRQLHIRYTLQSPLGVDLKGKQSQLRRDLQKRDVPEAGVKVAVLYYDDHIFRIL